jgi:hypothetical protein
VAAVAERILFRDLIYGLATLAVPQLQAKAIMAVAVPAVAVASVTQAAVAVAVQGQRAVQLLQTVVAQAVRVQHPQLPARL